MPIRHAQDWRISRKSFILTRVCLRYRFHPVTSEEFREAIEALEMPQSQAAAYLRVTQATVSRWASGARPVPGIAVKVLEDALAAQEATR